MSEGPEYDDLEFIEATSEDELLAMAVERMRVSIPEWVPDESQTEMVLLQAMCLLVGMEVYALNELPETVLEQLLGLYGLERSEGVRARAQVEFGVDESAPTQTIPNGTRLRFTLESTGETYDLVTTESVTVTTSQTLRGTAWAELEEPGAAVNGLANVELDVADPLFFVEWARLSSPILGGQEPESDERFFNRGSAVLRRQVATLVLPEHFELAVLEDERVGRAAAFSLRKPGVSGDQLGHVTVVVTDREGEALDADVMEALQVRLTKMAAAGLSVHVAAPAYAGLTITVSVATLPAYDGSVVRAAVEAALRSYFSPLGWPWRPSVSRNEVIGAASKVPGVAWVLGATVALTGQAAADDVPIAAGTAVAGLPRVDDVTVTVVTQ